MCTCIDGKILWQISEEAVCPSSQTKRQMDENILVRKEKLKKKEKE